MASLNTSPVAIHNDWSNFNQKVTGPATIDSYTKESFVIASKGLFQDNTVKETSIIQGLLPNRIYKITFDILKQSATDAFEPVSSDGDGEGQNMTPAQIQGVPTSYTNVTPGGFFWNDVNSSGLPEGSTLYYKTLSDTGVGTTLTPVSWGNSRGADGEPNDQAGYVNFETNFRTYPINQTTGAPDTSNSFSPHLIDAFMFIFEKPESGDPSVNVTLSESDFWHMVINGATNDVTDTTLYETVSTGSGTGNSSYQKAKTYIGWNPMNASKGVKKFPDIHGISETPLETTLSSTEFIYDTSRQDAHFPVISAYGPGGQTSGRLRKDRKYYIAMMFYDKTSQRIITNQTYGTPKWVSTLINFGGEWSISLGTFRDFVFQGSPLTNASAVSIDIDGFGVKGSYANNDLFKIVMKATPIPTILD